MQSHSVSELCPATFSFPLNLTSETSFLQPQLSNSESDDAWTEGYTDERSLHSGFSSHLTKPIDPVNLFELIEQLRG